MTAPTYTYATAIAQVEKCDFECDGGPLANNAGWRWIKDHLPIGPKFRLGQWVWFKVDAEVNGIKLSQWVKLVVVAIYLSSDTERQTYTYALSSDPPQPYHYGCGVQFNAVAEGKLFEARPDLAQAA
jgi:hypothetical protein